MVAIYNFRVKVIEKKYYHFQKNISKKFRSSSSELIRELKELSDTQKINLIVKVTLNFSKDDNEYRDTIPKR